MVQFVVTFQTPDRERFVVCSEDEVAEQVIFHKERGHQVSVVPREVVESEEFC
jgi:hypothetical protein